jgi:hypothetical protein
MEAENQIKCSLKTDTSDSCECEDECIFSKGIEIDDRVVEAIQGMQHKYYQLVSYARKRPEDIIKYNLERFIKEVEFLYEDETNNLKNPEMGDWQHGFNSGALAAFRYVLTITDVGIDQADEDFPELDT